MRGVVGIFVLAGCGRFGFGDQPPADARGVDSAPDSSLDAPGPPSGLIGWWKMDDDPADGVLDDSGPGSHAAHCVTGVSCPTTIAGVHGNAIRVDGMQFARVTWGAWLGTGGPFTYAAWVYVEQDVDQVPFARPVGIDVGDSWDVVTWSVATGTGTCLEDADGAGTNQAVCGATTPMNQWVHVTGRWDGATSALFMNGTKVAANSAPAVMFDMHDIVIGTDENMGSPAYQFHGRIDDLQLFDRALTDTEITVLAQ